MREAASKGQVDPPVPGSQSVTSVSSKPAPKPSSGYISVSDVFSRSQSMTDLTKAQGSTRTTPSDIVKNKALPMKGVPNKDAETSGGLAAPSGGADSKGNEIKMDGKMTENLASLTELLLQNKTQFTLAQLSGILNVPVNSSTQGLLEKIILNLSGKLTGVGSEKETADSAATIRQAVAELLSIQHGVSVKMEPSQPSAAAGSGPAAEIPGRRYTQQSSYNAASMSISEESNNSVGGVVEESGANVSQHTKSRESSEQYKLHRRVHSKDPLGLEAPLSAKAKVQNYLERFDQDKQGSNTGTSSGFKTYNQSQYK